MSPLFGGEDSSRFSNDKSYLTRESTYFHVPLPLSVNPATGEYFEAEADLVVAGVQPLSFRRMYGHLTEGDLAYGGWNTNPESLLLFCICHEELGGFVGHGTEGGAFYRFDQSRGKSALGLSSAPGYTHDAISGGSHPANTVATYGRDKKEPVFSFCGEIRDGDGRIRKYRSDRKAWPCPTSDEVERSYQTRQSPPFMAKIWQDVQPNGNILEYHYTNYNQKKQVDPEYFVLTKICAYDRHHRQSLGELSINFVDRMGPKNLNIYRRIEVEGSDGRKANYVLGHRTIIKKDKKKKHPYTFDLLLASVETPDRPQQRFGYTWPETKGMKLHKMRAHYDKYCFLSETVTRDGTPLEIHYSNRKVSKILAPVGPNGERSCIASYSYGDHQTTVTDGEGNRKIYRFDDQKRITSVETADSIEKQQWSDTGDLIKRELCDKRGIALQTICYKYDACHNRILENLGAQYIKRRFDEKNRLVEEENGICRKTYKYDHCLVTEECIYDGSQLKYRKTNSYDDAACLIKSVIEDGPITRIIEIEPKRSLPNYGLPLVVRESDGAGKLIKKKAYTYTAAGQVASESHYDCHDALRYTLCKEYDDKERLVKETDALGQITTYSYDERNNLVDYRKAGFTTQIIYDAANRPVKQIEGELVTQKVYNASGQVVAEVDPRGETTHFVYDACGRLTKTLYADGGCELKEFDAMGNVTLEQDGNGFQTKTSYNERGLPRSISYADGSMESFSYDQHGRKISYTDKHGMKTTYSYDALSNVIEERRGDQVIKRTYSGSYLITEVDPLGYITHYSYDSAGRRVSESKQERSVRYLYDPLGRCTHTFVGETVHQTTFDLLNRPLSQKTLVNKQTLRFTDYRYDASGNVIEEINAQGSHQSEYDRYGHLISETDREGNSTSFVYEKGLLIAQTNGRGITTHHEYDVRGRCVHTYKTNGSDARIEDTVFGFDHNGNCTKRVFAVYEGTTLLNHVTHTFAYGPCDALLETCLPDGHCTKYSYDTRGRLCQIWQPDGTTFSHIYDFYGRLTGYHGAGFHYSYVYDEKDRLLEVSHGFQKTTRSYNAHDEVISETLVNGATLVSSYNSYGQRTQLTLPDGSTIKYSYLGDDLHKVIRGDQVHTYQRDQTGAITECCLPMNLGKLHYTRDKLGRPVNIVGPSLSLSYEYDENGNVLYENQIAYSYNDLDQLIRENECAYRCDSLSNRLEEGVSTDGFCCRSDSKYDENGNTLVTGYKYDSQNRLIESPETTYTYDSFHRRMSKTYQGKATYYLWDGENEIGSFTSEINELRVLGEGLGAEIGAAVLLELNGSSYVPLHDHRGCVRRLVSDMQTLEYSYTAFGDGNSGLPWGYLSKRHDEESGLVYFGRRYYMPLEGRWLTPDPSGASDGPNLYAYVHHNPHHIDLYGLRDTSFLSSIWKCTPPGYLFHKICQAIPEKWVNPVEPCFTSLGEHGYDVKPVPENRMIIMHGGMLNTKMNCMGSAKYVSDLSGGYDIHMVQNISGGWRDILRVGLERFGGREFKQVDLVEKALTTAFKAGYSEVMYISHSEGGMQAGAGFSRLSSDLRDRIWSTSIAAARPVPRELCARTENFVAAPYRDFVPLASGLDLIKNRGAVTMLKSHPEAPRFDHTIRSPTYRRHLQSELESFITGGVRQ